MTNAMAATSGKQLAGSTRKVRKFRLYAEKSDNFISGLDLSGCPRFSAMFGIRNWTLKKLIRLVGIRERGNVDNIPLLREKIDYWSKYIPHPKWAEFQKVDVDGIEGEWIIPEGASEEKVLLYLHGGGYAIASVRTHHRMIARLCRIAGIKALGINYRLMPEHRFPAPVEDALRSYDFLLRHGYSPAHIAIGGDSAGGGLAVATAVALRDRGQPLPACLLCVSPWADLEGTGKTNVAERNDGILNNERLRKWGLMYADSRENLRHPLASPIYADLAGLPPLLIQVSEEELLLDDAIRLYGRRGGRYVGKMAEDGARVAFLGFSHSRRQKSVAHSRGVSAGPVERLIPEAVCQKVISAA